MTTFRSAFLSILFCATASLAAIPADWLVSQDLQVTHKGMVKVRLPMETLGMLQPSLMDLRLVDASGVEYPYLIERPEPTPARDLPLDRVTATMVQKKTVITGMVPAAMQATGFESIALYTPTDDFLKPISLEGSQDGKKWTMLVHQAPIFKQTGDPWSSTLRFGKGSWTYLRITLDDTDTPPLRVSQVRLFAPGRALADFQEFEPKILEMASDGQRTELRLQLPADGLPIRAIRLDVPETTFRRQVRVANREFTGGEFKEVQTSQGSIYRISLGSNKADQMTVPVHAASWNRQITVTIENGDSPPLTIRHLWVQVIPRDLIFDAPAAGTYSLCLGNPKAPGRAYDVASLQGAFKDAVFQKAMLGPIQPNLEYHAPAGELENIEEEGSDINTDPWHFRKKVIAEPLSDHATLWRIELDPEAIAHYGGRLQSVRLVRKDMQLPYVIDYAGVERSLAPGLEKRPNAPKGKSQWSINLPYAGMPIARLRFTVPNSLFQRNVTLYEFAEERPDDVPLQRTYGSRGHGLFGAVAAVAGLLDRPDRLTRSNDYPPASANDMSEGKPCRNLGYGSWVRTKPGAPASFEIVLQDRPQTGQLILETDNGDNSPISLETVQAYYQAPRLLFRAKTHKSPLYLYYGQPEVSAPQYDLNLIAAELLSTPPQEARLEAEEALKAKPWWGTPAPEGGKKIFFWAVMGLVVLGLFVVIAKLLPEESEGKKA